MTSLRWCVCAGLLGLLAAAPAFGGGMFHAPKFHHMPLHPIPLPLPHARLHHIPIPVKPFSLPPIPIPVPYVKIPRQHFHYHYNGCPVDLTEGHYEGYAVELDSHRTGPRWYGAYGDEQRSYWADTYGQPVFGYAFYESKLSYQEALAKQREEEAKAKNKK